MLRWLTVERVATGITVVIAVLMGQAVRLWGITWIAITMGLVFAFLLGWGAARRTWRKRGYVPKL